jgi:hypothetical protein
VTGIVLVEFPYHIRCCLKTRKTQPCPSALITFFNVPLDASPETRAKKGDGHGEDGRRQSERLKRVWPLESRQGVTTPMGYLMGYMGSTPGPGIIWITPKPLPSAL